MADPSTLSKQQLLELLTANQSQLQTKESQLQTKAAGLGDALEEADLIPAHLRRKPKKKRDESLPANLPRYEVVAELPEDDKICPTHGEKTLLPESMWDRTETLEFERPKLNVFDFTVSRHRDGPELFFNNYTGTLLGDCWHGFKTIATNSNGQIVRAACNAHARRKIHESTAYPADRALWLKWYQELYDIEDRGKTMPLPQRLLLRQSEAKPIWKEIALWLEEVKLRTTTVILPKSDFGKALQYIRNHFTELTRYLVDPSLPIDNNQTEQLMKQVAIGRKNWLFAGSVAAGERSSGFMTLVSSALRNDLDVWIYIKDILDQLLSGVTDYQPLLPWNWAAQHPQAIRKYRIRERRQRTDRMQTHRARRRKRKPARN